ncbi:Mitochondrial acidic protein mam33, partial [Massospora cicadina]
IVIRFSIQIYNPTYSTANLKPGCFQPKMSIPSDLHDSDLTCKAFVFAYAILEEHVKEAFEIHIENRGVDHTLSHFIRAYAKFKDQTERMIWLANLRKFMLA